MKDLNLGLFSRYRGELMGVATLLIILCHMYPNGVKMPIFMRYVLANGGAGCDVFLFLSGFGICHSYHGNIVKEKLYGIGMASAICEFFAMRYHNDPVLLVFSLS